MFAIFVMFQGIRIDKETTSSFHVPSNLPGCMNATDITVVTAFLNIGPFGKGEAVEVRTSNIYKRWMRAFKLIKNPVVAFFNNQSDYNYFRRIRSNENTKLIKIDLANLWAFKLAPDIAQVYAQDNYPRFHPNTVFPAYTCAVHSKYELTLRAIAENPFRTRYFAFIDVGYFRNLAEETGPAFSLQLPPGFDPAKVAYQEVYKRQYGVSVSDIFMQKVDWVAGGYFVAQKRVMTAWCEQYIRFTETMLARKLMNADQAIIYGMTVEMENKKTSEQVFLAPHQLTLDKKRCPDYWMCLGYYSMCQ